MLPKRGTYVKKFVICIEDDELLKKYNDIWNKVSNSIKKEFGSKPIFKEKFLKIKLKSYGVEATDFHDKEMSKVGSNYTCNWIRTHNHLVHKRTLNHLAKLAK